MLYYKKKSIENSKNKYFFSFLVLSSALFFQPETLAEDCTLYVVNQDTEISTGLVSKANEESEAQPVEFDNIDNALAISSSGDVICFKAGVYSGITLEGIQGGDNKITVRSAPDNQVLFLNSNYSGTGILIKDSKNLVISNLTVSGGLFGIYAIGSSDLTISDNTIYDVGQEAISIKSGNSSQTLNNFLVADNVITGTGKKNSQYGEGIYIGDGNDNYNQILHNITIENNNISKTLSEAIDIKINTKNVTIDSNAIVNTSLKFNGAITVATSDRFGEDSNVIIKQNSIVGVENRLGYRPLGIAVGHGNAFITGNMIIEQEDKFVAVCLFSTFMNENANTVTLGDNKTITEGYELLRNCGSGGTGASSLANVIESDVNSN